MSSCTVEVLYETPLTRQSATIIASARGYCDVLRRLIQIGIDHSRCDSFGHSALFYASRNGQAEVVEILNDADARTNDGSLQEAAREGHSEIVDLLLTRGHRADFPSGLHMDGLFGRNALEELCLNSEPVENIDDWNHRIDQCIQKLLPKAGTDVQKTNGKTMLHLALENKIPIPITRLILEFPAVWENINHSVHLFQDSQGYFYSPTKYVDIFCIQTDPKTQQELTRLLRAKKCDDKFYAHTVDQPLGAVGLPEDIAISVDKQRRQDHEHSEAIKRQKELATQLRAIEAEDHQRKITTDRERHNLLNRQRREREDNEKQEAQRRQALERTYVRELQAERQAAIAEENRLRQQALSEEASRREAIQRSKQAAELAHKRNLASQEYAAMEQKMSLERRLIQERDEASRREVERTMDILRKREATAKYESGLSSSGFNNGY